MASKNRGPRGQKRANKVKARKHRRPAGPRFGSRNFEVVLDAYTESLGDDFGSDAVQISALVHTLVETLAESTPRFVATAWVPDDAHFLLDEAEESEDPDLADASIAAAISYLAFLRDSGRWTGTSANLEHCLEDLKGFLYPDEGSAMIARPVVDPEVELAALSTLPMLPLFDEMLESVGTPTMGARIEELDPDSARVWDSAVDAGLLETASKRAYRGPEADPFVSRSLPAVRAAVAAYIGRFFIDYKGPGASLVNLATQTTYELVLQAMTDEPPARPEDTGTEFEDLALNVVRNRLDIFVEQGWLEFDDAYRVPIAFRPSVLDGLEEYDRSLDIPQGQRFTVTVTVDESDPPQWRRFSIDSALPLDYFHHVLQAAFGGQHSPPHQFTSPALAVEDEPFAPDEELETSVPVAGILDADSATATYVGNGRNFTVVLDAVDEFDGPVKSAEVLAGSDEVDLAAANAAVDHIFAD